MLRPVEDVIGTYAGAARVVLDYTLTMKRLVDAAKRPGFNEESWDPLAKFVDTATFLRVGNLKEVMSWREYVAFLTQWAATSEWECSFKRLTGGDGLVLLELEERSETGGASSVVNSVSVYEFDGEGNIRHLDIYLQMPMPELAMLKSQEGVTIAE